VVVGALLLLVRSVFELRFLGQHHGNFVADRIHPPARHALQAGFVGQKLHACLANRANQNIEGVFRNGQRFSPIKNQDSVQGSTRHFTKRLRKPATQWFSLRRTPRFPRVANPFPGYRASQEYLYFNRLVRLSLLR